MPKSRKPESIFFDSNVYINALRFPEYEQQIERFFQGAYQYTINKIVLMELWAGVRTKLEEDVLRQHQKSVPLIGMRDDNFITAGQILHKMREQFNLEPQMRRRLTWDILIALSAKENNAVLITENESDFARIRRFSEFEYVAAK